MGADFAGAIELSLAQKATLLRRLSRARYEIRAAPLPEACNDQYAMVAIESRKPSKLELTVIVDRYSTIYTEYFHYYL